jgi:hypothetical protein
MLMNAIPTVLPPYFALPFSPGIAMRSGVVEASSRTSPGLVGFRIGFLVGSFLAANLLRAGLLYRENRVTTILLNVAHCSTKGAALLEPSLKYRLSKYSIYLNTNLLLLPVSLPDRRFSC